MTKKEFIANIRNLIAQDEIKAALEKLQLLLQNSPKLNEVLLQSSRFNAITRQIKLGQVGFEDGQVTQNQIKFGLLEFVSGLEQKSEVPEIKGEVEQAIHIINSKNVITSSSFNAGGNIHVGDKKTIINPPSLPQIPKELTRLPRVSLQSIIGREKEIDQLHHYLHKHTQAVVVNGMGGIGKTTLVGAYCTRYHEYYKHIAWVTETEQGIALDLIQKPELLSRLQINPKNLDPIDVFNEVVTALQKLSAKPKLFIIDNATVNIEKYLPLLPSQPDWHLLMTSRTLIGRTVPMKLNFLSPDKAIILFRRLCPRIKDEKAIAEIVKLVEYHTLTIEILARTAKLQRTSIEGLQNALEVDLRANIKTEHSRLEPVQRITSYLTSIFNLSHLNENERWLLKQFSCLPPEFLDYQVLFNLINPEATDRTELFSETLEGLVSKGWLIKEEKEEELFKLHRIIKEVLLNELKVTEEDVLPLIDSVAGQLSMDYAKDNPIDKFPWIPFGLVIANTFSDSYQERVGVLQNNLALVLKDLGDYEAAKALLEKAMHSNEQHFGANHPSTATVYSNLALVLQHLGDYEAAKALLEKAMHSDEQHFGEEHPSTAISYSNLALVLKDLGDYEAAKALLEKAMHSAEQYFGEDHPSTATVYSNLALVLQDLGDYEGAKALLEKAMHSDEQHFGEDHPTTAISYSNLAAVLQDLGDYEAAKALLEKAMHSNEQHFGANHPSTATVYSNLALVLQHLGDYEAAKALLEKAMHSDEQNFGEEHPTTAISYSNLALVLQDLGDYEAAKALLEKAMHSDEQHFGEEHPTTARSYSNLALVLKDLGDYEAAKALLEKAMHSAEQHFGEDHPSTAKRYFNLGQLLRTMGNYKEAKVLLEKAMHLDEQNFGFNHPSTGISYNDFALVLQNLGDYETALTYATKCLAIWEATLPADHPYIRIAKNNIKGIEAAIKGRE